MIPELSQTHLQGFKSKDERDVMSAVYADHHQVVPEVKIHSFN